MQRVSYSLARRHDVRRNRRLSMPPLDVVIRDQRYVTTNWSFGGFLIGDFLFDPETKIRRDDRINGLIGWGARTDRFEGAVARADRDSGLLAVRFLWVSDLALETFDQRIRHVLAGPVKLKPIG